MSEWNSQAIFLRDPDLRLTEAQRTDILSRMPPPAAQDGQIYIDAVFEGGGVRGLAFLGALRCCADLGLQWRKVAGTSAGAITAALVAANFPIDDLETIVGRMDYMSFLSKKTSPLIFNGDPSDDLQSPVRMFLLLLIARRMGQYSSEPFRDWIAGHLHQRGLKTFADVRSNRQDFDLKVVASDISRGEMLVLPDDLDLPDPADPQQRSLRQQLQLTSREEFSVAEAVRLSMSIPLFFEPGKLGDRKIVDGGILSNFPLWIFDFRPGYTPYRKCPRWPTFGFRLIETNNEMAQAVTGPFDLLGGMFKTMMVARDRHHLNQTQRDRVVNIDVTPAGITPTAFNLSHEKKEVLYRQGYRCAKEFFLHRWNWDRHLEQRGFDPQECRLEALKMT
jgi:NTE family protein